MALNTLPSPSRRRRWLALFGFAAIAVTASGLSFAAPPRAPAPASPLKIEGQLDPRVVQTLIASHADQVQGCYQDFLKAHALADGVLVLHWAVKDDGTVEETCQSHGTTIPHEVGRCVSERVSTWLFPSPGYAQRATVEYTFEFTAPPAIP